MQGVSEKESTTPVICLDMWEHSYWSENDGEPCEGYLNKFWESINWAKVSENYENFGSKGQVAPII